MGIITNKTNTTQTIQMKTTYLIAATLALAAAQQAQDPCALRSIDIDWANVENVTPEEFYEAAGPAADVYENACETGLLNREQCFAVGCCDWDDEEEACFSAVGQDVCDGARRIVVKGLLRS